MISHRDMLLRAYERIRHEYLVAYDPANHPAKLSMDLENWPNGVPAKFANTMFARLSDGHFGSKTIYVDEVNNRTVSRTLVFAPDGTLVRNCDATLNTALRCGLMAALCLQEALLLRLDKENLTIVGLIGCGAINAATAEVLHALFGISHFLVKGRPGSLPARFHALPGNKILVDDYRSLHACDAVISCTTNADPANLASVGDFERDGKMPYLFVTQDGGWILDESFRLNGKTFTDHPDQLDWEEYFAFDRRLPAHLRPEVQRLDLLDAVYSLPACVYLTGMAFTDLIMALENPIDDVSQHRDPAPWRPLIPAAAELSIFGSNR